MEIRFRHSIALVKNIEESKCFYRDIIGLKVIEEFDTFILFQDNFAIHTADLFYTYINKPYHGEKMGHDNVDFYFTTSDLEGMQKKLKEEKVTFIHEIYKHAWGEKESVFTIPMVISLKLEMHMRDEEHRS
jgi:catechol 2,3-dioxygenase-like lactoylglutathione lyase family enzyme